MTNITNGVCKKTIITKTRDNISIYDVTIGCNIVDIRVQSSKLVERAVNEFNRKDSSKIEKLSGIDGAKENVRRYVCTFAFEIELLSCLAKAIRFAFLW